MEDKQDISPVEENYIETIKKLKDNSVSKEEYEKVLSDNKNLLDSLINGNGQQDEVIDVDKGPSVEEIRKELFNPESNLSNLDYCKKALELRKKVMEGGEVDPFLPNGNQILASDYDRECANRVAEVMQECIDYADGDSAIFTNELQRRTIDIKIIK